MPRRCRGLPLALLVAALAVCAAAAQAARPAETLPAFGSETELERVLARWQERARQRHEARLAQAGDAGALWLGTAPAPMAAPPVAAAAAAAPMRTRSARPGAEPADGITNVQTAGVDEGGIVKRAGEYLVVLRRGRLFTLRIGADRPERVHVTEAHAPMADPRGAWYDELLISERTVVVVGYSHARGGTEIGLFDLAGDGRLQWRATHHLRSFDYYSARNFASRLVGRRLVFYTPTLLVPDPAAWQQAMPAQRAWWPKGAPEAFERILPASRIFRADDEPDPGAPLALHTVTSCDLSAQPMRCESTAVLGGAARVFYVSSEAVYVWAAASARGNEAAAGGAPAALYRMPLSGAAPSGIRAVGVPVDQLSFLEDTQGASGRVHVLLRAGGGGEGLFAAGRGAGPFALLSLPLAALGDGRGAAAREHYRRLPGPVAGEVHNRFVGEWLVWGGAASVADPGAGSKAWALSVSRGGGPVRRIELPHTLERIEPVGQNAVLVGTGRSDESRAEADAPITPPVPAAARALLFSPLRLDGSEPRLEAPLVLPGLRQGETRTHGFFYRADDEDSGVLGLPVLAEAAPGRAGVYRRGEGAASVVFLRNRGLRFAALGALESAPEAGRRRDDGCRASCVDWYGNARPIFIGERVFALMGYELVEGRLVGRGGSERIEERHRLDFAPAPRGRDTRPDPFVP